MLARLRPMAVFDPVTAALRRAGHGSGQFRPSNRSTIMSQLSFSSFDDALLVRDAQGRYLPASADQILEAARQAIEQKMQRGAEFSSPAVVKEYLRNMLAGFEHEVFAVMFLDTRHRLIEYAEMFRGTIDSASVYPREVVKAALRLNAGAVVLSHNHPSGNPEPSQADKALTQRLKDALALVEVRTLDHIIVAGSDTVSFAERGLI
ncbi:RadC family protein [Aeromonas caviae]|uniref:RadC family protein n=1 Tax=Aeromonas caviae TaxID=648 RepID=UPI002087F80C|nr:hypothetical protein KAM354_09230 [Aeromonas caviae]